MDKDTIIEITKVLQQKGELKTDGMTDEELMRRINEEDSCLVLCPDETPKIVYTTMAKTGKRLDGIKAEAHRIIDQNPHNRSKAAQKRAHELIKQATTGDMKAGSLKRSRNPAGKLLTHISWTWQMPEDHPDRKLFETILKEEGCSKNEFVFRAIKYRVDVIHNRTSCPTPTNTQKPTKKDSPFKPIKFEGEDE